MITNRVILMGGLGNQLFQYAFALSLAAEHNQEIVLDPNLASIRLDEVGRPELSKFIIDRSVTIDEISNKHKMRRKLVGLGIRLSLKNETYANSYLIGIIRYLLTKLDRIYLGHTTQIFFATDNGYDKNYKQESYTNYYGYFQSYKFSSDKDIKDKLLRLKPRISSQEIAFFASKSIEDRPLIVHIRLTDYRNEPNFGILSKEYYFNAIRDQINSGSYRKIWLFSDEAETAIEYVPAELISMVENISTKISGTIETFEIMRLGKGYVLGNSSFSWWGAYLSYEIDARIIYPSPWFSGMPTPRSLCPPAWLPFPR